MRCSSARRPPDADRARVGPRGRLQVAVQLPLPLHEEVLPETTPTPREEATALSHGLMEERETLELVRAYYHIGDPRVRKRLFEMTKALAAFSQQKD